MTRPSQTCSGLSAEGFGPQASGQAGWLQIFVQQVAEKGNAAVARELGVSPTTISLLRAGKYPASTNNIEKRVLSIYGSATGLVDCPVKGEIEPGQCAHYWECAKKIGMKAPNPQTLRLYKTCMKCGVRN